VSRVVDYRTPVAASYEYQDDTQVLLIRTPYNPAFIKEFKEIVPYSARTWDSERKLWIIKDIDYTEDVLDLMSKYFPNFLIGDI